MSPVKLQAPPTARMADNELEDLKERPARRRTRKSRRLLWSCAILLGVMVLLLFAGGGAAWWYFVLRPKGLTDELNYMPDNFEWIASARVATIVESDFYKSLKKEMADSNPDFDRQLKDMEADLGLELKDIDRVTVGGLFPRKKGPAAPVSSPKEDVEMVMVIKTRKKVTLSDVFRTERYKEFTDQKFDTYTVRVFARDKMAICVPDSNTIVMGEQETLRQVLLRSHKVKVTQSMQDAMKRADFTDVAAAAFHFGDAVKEALRDNARDSLPSDVKPPVDPEKFTRYMDNGVIQLRLGSELAIEVQVYGNDSKLAMSFSIKTTALLELIHDAAKSNSGPADTKRSPPVGRGNK